MVRLSTSRRSVAWLALLAMALIVVMPAISRVMPMPGGLATAMPGMDASCMATQAAGHAGSPHAPADPMARCGYCVLLSHTPLLASSFIVHVLPAAPNIAAPATALPVVRSAAPQLSADPRGPPALS